MGSEKHYMYRIPDHFKKEMKKHGQFFVPQFCFVISRQTSSNGNKSSVQNRDFFSVHAPDPLRTAAK